MKRNKRHSWLVVGIGLGWVLLSLVFTHYNAPLYQETIVQIQDVSQPKEWAFASEQTQKLSARVLNGTDKGKQVSLQVAISYSEALTPRYQRGDQLFVAERGGQLIVTNVKRDRYVLILLGLFALLVWWVGQRQGLASLGGIALNLILLSLTSDLYLQHPALPLVALMLIAGSLSTALSLCLGSGWNKKTAATVLATLLASFSAWLIGVSVFRLFHDQGLRYEEMPFLTRPYRPIFIASLFLGTLGAAMDIAMTVVATVTELLHRDPKIATRDLLGAGQQVGKHVMGSMASVLLFAYLSGGLPTIVLYLKNGWDFMPSIEMTLSLELARALVGAIGIVLTIPLSVFVVRLLYRKGGA